MKKKILNLFVVTSVALATIACKSDKKNQVTPAEAQETAMAGNDSNQYEIDTKASTIEWKGKKPTGEHVGIIEIESGTFTATKDEIESGNLIIDMETISVKDEGISDKDRENLENHLKGTARDKETDFFNVKKYPTATFKVTGINEKDGKKMLQGNLTIKEETKNIEFPVTTSINEEEILLESEPFIIDRTDWKVNYGSKSVFDNLGDNFISDDMELKIKVKATRS